MTLDDLRRFAVTRSLFKPTTLKLALDRLGFVQADPIRAPARAQDLMLRHRVKDYRAGELERRYSTLGIEEDFFVNYGFLTNSVQALMHPRLPATRKSGEQYANPTRMAWPAARQKQADLLLEFIRERGSVHPREVDEHFSHGKVLNYWGGSSNATTHLLDAMHYRGLLRVARRETGIRIYESCQHGLGPADIVDRFIRIDKLVDVAVRIYAPLPAASLSSLVSRLRFGVPQWQGDMKDALQRVKQRLSHARVDGVDWYWPSEERLGRVAVADKVHLLTPFDPVVWDRGRFALLWGWTYRFEAYTPVAKRKRGYYALPILWRDSIIGWGNLTLTKGELKSEFGYVKSQPRDRSFKRELEEELDRMRAFLALAAQA